MSVYTPVTAEELEAWLTRYAVGQLVSQSPIATGIENTNYFVTTTNGRFLTGPAAQTSLPLSVTPATRTLTANALWSAVS